MYLRSRSVKPFSRIRVRGFVALVLGVASGCSDDDAAQVSDATSDGAIEAGGVADTKPILDTQPDFGSDATTDASLDVAPDASDSREDSDTAFDAVEADGSGDRCGDVDGSVTPEPGWTCCAIGAPSCSCSATGGSPDQPGGCHSVCDSPPVGWVGCFDKHGCRFWKPASGSCLKPDAALDG